jgi:hypothetical protein
MIGTVYGHQWRNFGATSRGRHWENDGVDQFRACSSTARSPSRRHIVTGWNRRKPTVALRRPHASNLRDARIGTSCRHCTKQTTSSSASRSTSRATRSSR